MIGGKIMGNQKWITEGFEAFRRGTFGNSGHNLYVSKSGVLQRIFQYDLNRDGWVDLVFANCQNHGESAKSYVYNPGGNRSELPAQGALCSMVLDINGDGYDDIVLPGRYDMVSPYASCDIYYGSENGYSEKYHIRIPTPWTADCCYGDFDGSGKPTLVFAQEIYKKIRFFKPTQLGLEWTGYTDLDIKAALVCAADLDGDGYDDLVVRPSKHVTETTVYWGGEDGINPERFTILPELDASEILPKEQENRMQSNLEEIPETPRLLQAVKWDGKNCFTLSTGKKVIFFCADGNRNIVRALEFPVHMALAVAVSDLDGDGYDDIAVAGTALNTEDPDSQYSFILWNGPEGFDKRQRTAIATKSACHVSVLGDKVLFACCNAGNSYTNDSLLFTYPDFENPQRFEGEDTRRAFMIKDKNDALRIFLNNRFSRQSSGFDEVYIYWGSKDGYHPDNRQSVPGHCAVDSLICDFNDDGWAELLIGNNSENSGHLDPGHHMHYFGPDGFQPERTHTLETTLGWGVVCSDFDRDGYLEVITPANHWRELRLFSARDNFTTYKVIELPKGSSARKPVAVDLTGNGWLDLIVPCGSRNSVIYWGGPEGFDLARSQELATRDSSGVAAADLTKNGYPDLIVSCRTDTPKKGEMIPHHPHHSYLHIYWNGPEGISEHRKCLLKGDAPNNIAIADFNNDGWLDIFAGSYRGEKDRDINSYLYWNREGSFSERDCTLLMTHSASGNMAADFNEDGYIDLAVANHKVYGDHSGFSTVWWNGPNGFNRERTTDLPTEGPHGMISTEIGSILDRGFSEYYYSEEYAAEKDCTVANASFEGDVPPKTAVTITMRVNGGKWVAPNELKIQKGDKVQYRLELYAYNCLRTPRITKVSINFA